MQKREHRDFPLKIFCLRVPKNFVEEPFCVSENLWYRKMSRIEEVAGITIFRRISFVSVPKHLLEEPFCVSEKFWYQNFACISGGGGITIFRRNK